MLHPSASAVELVCVRLEVESPDEIHLEEVPTTDPIRPVYRACVAARWTYVDRPIAISLRERGAIWRGDVARDPCAVA